MTTLRLGLIINPIAGVGAALAWKGTDDIDRAWKAVDEGEPQPVWTIIDRALKSIPSQIAIDWIIGGDYSCAIEGEVVYQLPQHSTAEDTKAAVMSIEKKQPDLIIFAGGDGTAADIAEVTTYPILGIPAGVKIFSPVFLHRPEDLGNFLSNWEGETIEVDVLDLDEDAYRQGQAIAKLITSATIPVSATIQSGKISWSAPDSETFSLIAERIEDDNLLDQSIMIGPGSTMRNIFRELGMELSLLGVDIVDHGQVRVRDGTAEELELHEIDEIWLSPIGHQGHIFGRGNRQITPKIIAKVGTNHIRIFSTLEKIRETESLYVDTADPDLDNELRGFLPVIVGYHEEILKRVL